ncbi:MAG TPA: protein-L-isoaspartate(D-aspartate) O-methyltransferase [Chryseolinea sp.]|nr:protein-L-isoaspartate(D-aspartate) O-methyltransferase [Chryseolinea sp.]
MNISPIILLCIPFLFAFQDDPFIKKREDLVVETIEKRGITNKAVLKSMKTVKRHLFVPENNVPSAYEDRPLPIGYGQTISQPFIVAYMTEVINPKPEYKVLEIGTGSGYQAAVLAEIVKEVYTIEIIPDLGNAASARLKKLGYDNVNVNVADGYFGWPQHGPFDAIVVTAAAEFVPPPLLEQLKEGGKIVIPIGSPFMNQMLMLIEKKGKKVTTKNLMPVVFVPFTRKKE